jgi:hypothetical protein
MSLGIKIISTPPGEAPRQVREAWVGLVLPLEEGLFSQPGVYKTVGPLSEFKSKIASVVPRDALQVGSTEGFIVQAVKAFEILAESSPDAARWWKKHTPQLFQPDRWLCFHTEVCEEVSYEEESGK